MYGWERFPPKAFSKLRHNWWDERNHNEQWRKFGKNQVAFHKYLIKKQLNGSLVNIILKFIIPYYSRYKERSTRKIGAMVQCSKIFSRYFNFRIILCCAPLSVSRSANVLPSSGHKYKYVALNFCIISRPPHLVYK